MDTMRILSRSNDLTNRFLSTNRCICLLKSSKKTIRKDDLILFDKMLKRRVQYEHSPTVFNTPAEPFKFVTRCLRHQLIRMTLLEIVQLREQNVRKNNDIRGNNAKIKASDKYIQGSVFDAIF